MAGDLARETRVGALGWGGLLAALSLAGFAGWTAVGTGSFLAAGAALHVGIAALVWLGVVLTSRREAAARHEALESQRLAALAEEGRRALFEEGRVDDEAARGLARFRQVGHAAITLILAAASMGAGAWLLQRFPREETHPSLAAAAIFGVAAFAFLVLGRFAFVLSREGGVLAAAGGRRALSTALVSLIACLGTAAHYKGLAQADQLGYVIVGIEALLGVEALLLLLLEVYRPRRAGEIPRPPFDSRMLGLLSSPADVARSIAQSLDYQFGFSISQTWLYQFMARWIVPLAVFACVSFWALSALLVVRPHEKALVRRMGRTLEPALEPGLHLKLPWPFDRAEVVPASRLLEVSTEHEGDEDEEGDHHGGIEDHHDGAILWTVKKWKLEEASKAEGNHLVLIARQTNQPGETPVNLISAAGSLHYRVRDVRAFAERSRDPAAVLRALMQRELCFLFGGEDLDRLLRERPKHAAALRDKVAAEAERLGLGVEVVSALLTDLHPPVAVGEAFEESSAAIEMARAQVLAERVRRIEVEERSRAMAERVELEAELRAAEKVLLAGADAARFGALEKLYEAAPSLFRITRVLEELAEGAAGKRKIVLGQPSAVTELDLQEKVGATELGLGAELTPGPAGGGEGK